MPIVIHKYTQACRRNPPLTVDIVGVFIFPLQNASEDTSLGQTTMQGIQPSQGAIAAQTSSCLSF